MKYVDCSIRNRLILSLCAVGFLTLGILIGYTIRSNMTVDHLLETGQYILVPTHEEILENGYPVNENNQTFGPNVIQNDEAVGSPDLLLAAGEDFGLGYVSIPDGISTLEELDDYVVEETIPVYLHDGETVIGEFKLG